MSGGREICQSCNPAPFSIYLETNNSLCNPERALRWELGDLGTGDGLSPAAALTIGESSLLLSARGDVAALQAPGGQGGAARTKRIEGYFSKYPRIAVSARS